LLGGIAAPEKVAPCRNPKRECTAIQLRRWGTMIFTLSYRQGSFAQSEIFGSLSDAMTGAYAKITKEGCSAFTIRDGGIVVMYQSQIQEHCQTARAALLQGRMPARH
jgi:hypothetical protein